MTDFLNIIFLSTLAGLATGIGGLIAIVIKPGEKAFGFLMGFTAGVMIGLSFGLVSEAWEDIGFLLTTIGFFLGSTILFLLDIFIPHKKYSIKENGFSKSELLNSGVLIAFGITLHNIPEGIAVGAGYLHIQSLGIFIAIAIALHNIPEGIAIALPIYKSGSSKLNAFKIALYSGLAEPIGAILATFFLKPFKSLVPLGLAFAGGVMIFITLDELVPCANRHGHEHSTALGIIIGVTSMFLLMGIFNI